MDKEAEETRRAQEREEASRWGALAVACSCLPAALENGCCLLALAACEAAVSELPLEHLDPELLECLRDRRHGAPSNSTLQQHSHLE